LAVGIHALFATSGAQPAPFSNAGSAWAMLTMVLGALIGFRTSQAYSRYWEGATLLLQVRGEWLNASSSLIAFCTSDPALQLQVATFQHQLVRLMSLLYCSALQQVCLIADEALEVIDMTGLDDESLLFLVETEERCDVLLQWTRKLIVQNMSSGVIPVPPPILTRVFQELSRGLVGAKDVQKIAEFPFPFPYAQLTAVLLFVQTALTPLMAVVIIGDPAWSAAVTFVSVLALWSTNFIASELEQPFGDDENDLPIADMMREMNIRLIALLDDRVKTPPKFTGCLSMDDVGVVDCVQSCLLSSRKRLNRMRNMYTDTSTVMSDSSESRRKPSWAQDDMPTPRTRSRRQAVALMDSPCEGVLEPAWPLEAATAAAPASPRRRSWRPSVEFEESPPVLDEGMEPLKPEASAPLEQERPPLEASPPPLEASAPLEPARPPPLAERSCELSTPVAGTPRGPSPDTDTADAAEEGGAHGAEGSAHGSPRMAAVGVELEIPPESAEVACVPRGRVGRASLAPSFWPAQVYLAGTGLRPCRADTRAAGTPVTV